MWRALRADLAYFRVFLFAAWAIAITVGVAINLLKLIFDGPPPAVVAALPAMFLMISSMIVGFIVQGSRAEERRSRLLLSGPLTPHQLAGVLILLPACFMGLGLLACGIALITAWLIAGEVEMTTLLIVANISSQLFAIVQMGPLAQEATAARRQRRNRESIAGWVGFAVAVLVLTILQGPFSRFYVIAGQLALVVLVMLGSFYLYISRTDFTR